MCSKISIQGCSEYGELQSLGTYDVKSSYSSIEVPLSAIKGGRFSRIVLSVEFQNPTIANWFEVETWGDTMYPQISNLNPSYSFLLAR